jgi:hypothetical protein
MHQYEKEEEFVLCNEKDPDLGGKDGRHAIRIDLPTVESFYGKPWEEAIKLIDGYGLPPENQKYDYYRDVLKLYDKPQKLAALEETLAEELSKKEKKPTSPTVEQVYDRIEEYPAEYENEIKFIKLQKKRSRQGYWMFVRGRPVYIDGDHYTYMQTNIGNAKRKKDGQPFYRDIDRKTWLFLKWAQTTTEATFKHKIIFRNKKGDLKERFFNKKTSAMMYAKINNLSYIIQDGDYSVDMGRRTVSGVVWATRRRQGKTFIMGHKGIKISCDTYGGTFAIQALTEKTAKDDVFVDKVRAPFEAMPFYFKPSNEVLSNKILYKPKNKSALAPRIKRNGGRIIVRSSENKAFDGNLLHVYGNDESGKKTSGDILHEYNDTIKNTLAQGEDIHGFAMYFSTFGDFESGGGRNFFEMMRASMSHKRNDLGQTQTGMVAYSNPAYDGYDDCIDEYGESIIDDPEEPYLNIKGVMMEEGAKSILEKRRAFLKEQDDWVGLNTEIRNNPFSIREARTKAVRTVNFDINILNQRREYLEFDEDFERPRTIDLEWEGGRMFTERNSGGNIVRELSSVKITSPPPGKDGKFILSLPPADPLRNKKLYDPFTGKWGPDPAVRQAYILGCDPFAFDNKDVVGKKKSNGGGHMFWKRDFQIDPNDSEIYFWKSNTTVMTYNVRAEATDEYCEDMLKAAVLFGAMVNTERNVGHIIKKFREWNCDGYLLHLVDPLSGTLSPIPGTNTNGVSKERFFSLVMDYVKYHAHREKHIEVIDQILDTETPEDMTDNDLFSAISMSLTGAESAYPRMLDETDNVSVWDMSN